MHRTGALYGQFETLEQQKDTASLGMWIFLVTEVMFFGGIMLTYAINRHTYFHAFAAGSNTISLTLGTINTIVLLASSFTMAMGVWSAQVGKLKLLPIFLSLTIILGFIFFGVKYVEYAQKFHHHLVPGRNFDIAYCVDNPSKCEDIPPQALEKEREEFLRQFKAQLKEAHTEIQHAPEAAVCKLKERHAGEAPSAEICGACYERLQERVDVLEAALHIDPKEAAQIVYDAVWADPSQPGQTYHNAANALLNELRQRAGVTAIMGPFEPLKH